MPFTIRSAYDMLNTASMSGLVTTCRRLPVFRDTRTGGLTMELLQEVTRSRAPLIEYEHVAVYTDAVLEVLPDETVKVVLQCRIDEPECKYTFCGKSYTMADLEAALVMAAEVRNLPAYRAHRARPEQLRKFLLIAKKVSNRGFMWRDVLYPSLADLVNAIAPTLDAQMVELEFQDPGWDGRQMDQPAYVRAIHKYQDFAVKEADAMLQQYYTLKSGEDLLDFLLNDITQSEEMGYFTQKALAISVFAAQLSSTARNHVMSFLSAYLNEDEASAHTDKPEVSNVKRQLAQSYMEYHHRQTQLESPVTLNAIIEEASGSGDSEDDEEDEEEEEEEEDEEAEDEEDKEEEDEEAEDEEEDTAGESEAGSSASSDVSAEEVE